MCKNLICNSFGENRTYWKRFYARLRHLERRSTSREKHKINYSVFDFWPGMDPRNCQIVDLFKRACSHKEWHYTQTPEESDIIFSSCYGSERLKHVNSTMQALHVLYLGENVRPRYDIYDYSLSFDQFSYLGRNIYWPLWMFELDLFSCSSYPDRQTHEIRKLTSKKRVDISKRKKRILYVGNNNEPLRMSIINDLKSAGFAIDCYGSQSNPVNDKITLASEYKVLLSLENSYYPGYCTEKIIHGYLSGCTSIIWGGKDPLLNCKSKNYFIDINEKTRRDYLHKSIKEALGRNVIDFDCLVQKEKLEARYLTYLKQIKAILAQFD